jgi:hypothetical protein
MRCAPDILLLVVDGKAYIVREALNNSSMNDQSKNISKCDFDIFFIFNGLSAIENGGTSMCRGTSEFFRGSLDINECLAADE